MQEHWWRRAACAGAGMNFFPDHESQEPALAFWCQERCPVVERCRSDALRWETTVGMCFGVAGGMTAAERLVIVRSQRTAAAADVDVYLQAHPLLSTRKLAEFIHGQGGLRVSYRTLARRRSQREVA